MNNEAGVFRRARASDAEIVEAIDREIEKLRIVLGLNSEGAASMERLVWFWEQHRNDYLGLRELYRRATKCDPKRE